MTFWRLGTTNTSTYPCTHITDRHLLNGLFSRTTRVSWQQKAKTMQDFHTAGDHGLAVASAGPYANHLHLDDEVLAGL